MKSYNVIVNDVNQVAVKVGNDIGRSIYSALNDDATPEQVIQALYDCNQLVTDTKRFITLFEDLLKENTYEVWYHHFVLINRDSGLLTRLHDNEEIKEFMVATLAPEYEAQRREHYATEIGSMGDGIKDILTHVTMTLNSMIEMQSELEKRRKAVL